MSKCHVRELSKVYECLFQDAQDAFPTLGGEFEKDLARLQRLSSSRGIHVYVVDLPAAGKHLDRCLADGQYKLSGLPLTKRFSGRTVIPKFLRGLYLLVFSESGRLKEDCNVEALFFLRQILFAAKKTDLDCDVRFVLDEVKEFHHVDSQLPEPENFWSSDAPSDEVISETYGGFHKNQRYLERSKQCSHELLPVLLRNLDLVSGILSTTLGPYRPSEWRFRHGPGAVSERTGPVNKYQFVNWSERLESVFPLADCGFHNHSAWAGWIGSNRGIGSEDPASRLISVRKTYTKPRLIAAEPSEHQWCQQNIWHYFCTRVRHSWIGEFVHFRDQTRNQELCREGSRTALLATVDLSAASDRVSCCAVGNLFRSNIGLLQALRASRTRFLDQKLNSNVPSRIELRKFSSMGSACTFPVESLMFLAVALASVLTTRKMQVTVSNISSLNREVTVFGDDIVIPIDSRELFVKALEVIDFKVNAAKSFWTGKFRESCGVDSYDGVVVTPAYWRNLAGSDPDSIVSMVSVRNNFYMKWLLHTARHLASTVQHAGMPVVSVGSGVCGLKSFSVADTNGLRQRWNADLQRTEVQIPVLTAQVKRTEITDDSALLQFFTEDPEPCHPWVGGVAQRPRLRLRRAWVPSVDLITQ